MGAPYNPHIFREYDIRGVAERDLTDEVTGRIGRAFAARVREEGGRTVILGQDVRESSPRLADVWSHALAESGLEVIRIGVVPTPVLYYAVDRDRADAGVMITGSHNPIEYNGFKLQLGTASLYGDAIRDLARRTEEGETVAGPGSIADLSVLDSYRQMVTERSRAARSLKIVVDAGNGTAGPVATAILGDLGHEVVSLYCEPDGRFPNHQPDPTVEAYMEDLKSRVVSEGADLGVGFDGDADRIGAVDETGRLLYGDQLLALFARDALSRHAGAPIVFDVKCSQGLPEKIVEWGGRPVMWKTGHSLTKAKMREEKAPVAGEMSGHMFFNEDFFGHDDAVYAAARLARILAGSPVPLSGHLGGLWSYAGSPEIRIDCPDEAKFRVVAEVSARFARDHDVVTLDGVRVRFEDGWGLLRASNTQPVLVLRFEGSDRRALLRIEGIFRELLRRYPEVTWRED